MLRHARARSDGAKAARALQRVVWHPGNVSSGRCSIAGQLVRFEAAGISVRVVWRDEAINAVVTACSGLVVALVRAVARRVAPAA